MDMDKCRIVFATSNEGKMKEVRSILADLGLPIISLKEAGITIDIDEDGATYEENACIKASAVHKLAGGIVMADDSGLEVDLLFGAPGVLSARYMGTDTPYEIKNRSIIESLAGATGEERSARFVSAIAVVMPDGEVITTRGILEGQIAYEPAGEGGFGYDPIFYLPDAGVTTAQLKPEEKNRISHRGKALRAMKEELKKRMEEAK